MRSRTRRCIYCQEEFEVPHGNKKHCPDKNCDYLAKLERQEKNYPVGNDAKAAIQKNHALFLRFAGAEKKTQLNLNKLHNKGFNQFGFYRYKVVDGVWHYYVHNYSFSINDNLITIWKH